MLDNKLGQWPVIVNQPASAWAPASKSDGKPVNGATAAVDWDIRTPPDVQYSYVIVGDSLGVSRIKQRRRRRSRIPVWAFAEGEARISATFHGAAGDAGVGESVRQDDGRRTPLALIGQSWANRRLLVAASPLLGVLALSGALALTYKSGGEDLAGVEAPAAAYAEQEPAAALQAGASAQRSKRIYDRLPVGQERGETEGEAPREEAAASAPAAEAAPVPAEPLSLPQRPSAVADPGPRAPGSAHMFTPAEPPHAPRRVRTVVVHLDGSVERPAEAGQPLVTAAAPSPEPAATPPEPAAPPPLETASAPPLVTASVPPQPPAAPETTGALQTAHLATQPPPAPAVPARAPDIPGVASKIGLPLPSPRRDMTETGFDAMPLPLRRPDEFTRPAAPVKPKVTYRAPKKTPVPESAWRPDAFILSD